VDLTDNSADIAEQAAPTMRMELFDAGSTLNILPTRSVPGMDDGYFRQIDMEYRFTENLQTTINTALTDTPRTTTLIPWPVPFPGRCWIDWTQRYVGEDGGPKINLYRHDLGEDDYSLTPASLMQIPTDAAYDPDIDAQDERTHDYKTMVEIQAEHSSPTEWLRRPLQNEAGGSRYGWCGLEQPVEMVHAGHTGDEYRLVVDYNPLFSVFDGRQPDWYDAIDSQGNGLSPSEKDRALSLRPEGQYRIYLRPANWRYVATVIAHYVYVSWFEMYEVQLYFTQAYHDRPPIYPTRHDMIHTSQVANIPYFGTYWSDDQGINDSFNASRAAAFLRFQIIDQQWWTLSEALIFEQNDPATIALWLWPPDSGDIVLGISRVDNVTGEDDIVWFKQKPDLTYLHPRTVIGSYINYDFVAY